MKRGIPMTYDGAYKEAMRCLKQLVLDLEERHPTKLEIKTAKNLLDFIDFHPSIYD